MTEDWSVFGVRSDGSWWRLYDSRPHDQPMTREWAEEAALGLNNYYGGWTHGAASYEVHPYNWSGPDGK